MYFPFVHRRVPDVYGRSRSVVRDGRVWNAMRRSLCGQRNNAHSSSRAYSGSRIGSLSETAGESVTTARSCGYVIRSRSCSNNHPPSTTTTT